MSGICNYDEIDSPVFPVDSNGLVEDVSGGHETKHPDYANIEARRQSFPTNWPQNPNQSSEDMSEAGFFYEKWRDGKKEDAVCCHVCGMLVYDWEAGDLPWKEHIKLNKDCSFAQEKEKFHTALTNLKEMGYDQSDIDQVINMMKTSGAGDDNLTSLINKALNHLEKSQEGASGTSSGRMEPNCISCKNDKSRVLFLPCACVVSCKQCALTTRTCFRCDKHVAEKTEVYFG